MTPYFKGYKGLHTAKAEQMARDAGYEKLARETEQENESCVECGCCGGTHYNNCAQVN